jgi:hypothetical protein
VVATDQQRTMVAQQYHQQPQQPMQNVILKPTGYGAHGWFNEPDVVGIDGPADAAGQGQ